MGSVDGEGKQVSGSAELLYLAHTALLCAWLTGWDILLLMTGMRLEDLAGFGQISACIAAVGVGSWWIRIRAREQRANTLRRGSTLLAFLVILLAMLPVDCAWTLPYHDTTIGFHITVLSLAVLSFTSRVLVWVYWWRLVVRKTRSELFRPMMIVVLSVFLAGLGIVTIMRLSAPLIDPSFATRATMRFDYGDNHINTTMNDKDLRVLKGMLRGRAYKDMPACGFGLDVSITLTDGSKSITFCPACDKCSGFRIGETERYINVSDDERDQFERIAAKYGMTFPCE